MIGLGIDRMRIEEEEKERERQRIRDAMLALDAIQKQLPQTEAFTKGAGPTFMPSGEINPELMRRAEQPTSTQSFSETLIPLQTQYGDVPEVQRFIAGHQQARLGRGLQALGDVGELPAEDKQRAMTNLMSNVGLSDKALELSLSGLGGAGGTGDDLGKSGVAAEIRATQANPEAQANIREQIAFMRNQKNEDGSPKYPQEVLDLAESVTSISLIRASNLLRNAMQAVSLKEAGIKASTPELAEQRLLTSQASVTGEAMGLKRLSQQDETALEGLLNSDSELNVAIDLFDEKFVGPLAGRAGNITEWLGTIGEDESVFRSTVQRFQNELLKARSGAAVSEQEFERLKRETLDFSLNPKTYMAKLKSNRDFIRRKYNRMLQNKRRANKDVTRFNPLGKSSATSKTAPPRVKSVDELANEIFGE